MSNEESQSFATEILHELKQTNKRLFTALITVLVLWFATIGAFIWYISLPVEYEEIVDIQNESGNANYIGRDLNGQITNGESESD